MGLKEKRKRIQREIEDLVKNGGNEKVIKELKILADMIEGLLKAIHEVHIAESNIP